MPATATKRVPLAFEAARPTTFDANVTALAGSLAFTLTQFVSFLAAFRALNRHTPSEASIYQWTAVAFLSGLVALALLRWAARTRAGTWPLAVGGLVGAALGVGYGQRLLPSLGPDGHLEWWGVEVGALVAIGAAAVAFGVLARRGRTALAWRIAPFVVACHILLYVTLAVVMLGNLGALEEEAALANEAPSGGFLAALAGLLAALWRTRRRAGAE